MITAIDTNVLMDVLIQDPGHAVQSETQLRLALEHGSLLICDIVYSELAGFFDSPGDLNEFLDFTGIQVESLTRNTLFDAGHAWRRYARQRGSLLWCSSCGERQLVSCSKCATTLRSRQHLAADFIIGAHALARADQLLSRDRGFYRTYFPELVLVS